VNFECPKCKAEDGGNRGNRVRYEYELNEIRRLGGTIGAEIRCPRCKAEVVELDDSAEINARQKEYKEFCQITEPLLALIAQTEGSVMLDDPEDRCRPDKMVTLQVYNMEKEQRKVQNDMNRVMRRDKAGGFGQHQRLSDGKVDVDVKVIDDTSVAVSQLDEDLEAMLRNEGGSKEVSEEVETIVIDGKTYTRDQITSEVLKALDEDEYERAWSFKQGNS
jgi:phage FluMu protein Com